MSTPTGRSERASCCTDAQDASWGRLPGAQPPLRWWIPAAVALVAALDLTGMPTPVDRGRPVGYAVVDPARQVRYATLDPQYLVNAFEVDVVTGAVADGTA
jgi:hypothetical protein